MSRKKNRKGGLIGLRKDPDFKKSRSLPPETVKKGKGLKAGSRHATEQAQPTTARANVAQDPRLGSKTPIALVTDVPVVEIKKAPAKAKAPLKLANEAPLSLEKELELLEQDARLNGLIDRLDEDEVLSPSDQAWLDQRLARHRELLAELGLLDDDDSEPETESKGEEEQLWDAFNNASLDDYKE